MKVHFACSTLRLLENKEYYLAICSAIKKLGHKLTRDWVDEAIQKRKEHQEVDRSLIYRKVIESLLTSEAVVIEGTISSFSIGHQIALALQKNKPILFLIQKQSNNEADSGLTEKSTLIHGISSPLIRVAKYDLDTVTDVLDQFFHDFKEGLSVKFNLVLTKEIDNYLDWASFNYKTNKSEFARRLIRKYMDEEDMQYQQYLSAQREG